jgi:transcriptional regulator with XRE-family HTH domain
MTRIPTLQDSFSGAGYAARLGSHLRDLRKARQWTQKHLASRLQLSESQISKYEAGTHSPPPDTLARFAAVFGLPADALLPELADTVVDLEPVEGALRENLRRLVALPSREKEAAVDLLRFFFAFRQLLLGGASSSLDATGAQHGLS